MAPHWLNGKIEHKLLFWECVYVTMVLKNYNSIYSRAQLIRVVTSGEWMVEEIVGVNEEENVVYFIGTFNSPLERHLYAVPLTGATATEEPTCLTCEDTGMHTITLDAQCQYIIDSSSDISRPPSVKVSSVHVPKSSWSSSSHAQNSKRTVTNHNNNSNEWLSLLFILHDASQQQQQHQQQLTIENKRGVAFENSASITRAPLDLHSSAHYLTIIYLFLLLLQVL